MDAGLRGRRWLGSLVNGRWSGNRGVAPQERCDEGLQEKSLDFYQACAIFNLKFLPIWMHGV